jgi:hypothetical protein
MDMYLVTWRSGLKKQVEQVLVGTERDALKCQRKPKSIMEKIASSILGLTGRYSVRRISGKRVFRLYWSGNAAFDEEVSTMYREPKFLEDEYYIVTAYKKKSKSSKEVVANRKHIPHAKDSLKNSGYTGLVIVNKVSQEGVSIVSKGRYIPLKNGSESARPTRPIFTAVPKMII